MAIRIRFSICELRHALDAGISGRCRRVVWWA
jgi:hypothetical protein